jgi:hypothetical protein
VPDGSDHPPNMNPFGYDHSSSRSQSADGSSNSGRVIDSVIAVSTFPFVGTRSLYNLLALGKSIAPTYWKIKADRMSETRYQSSP